jgi:hypothetical protein
MKIECQRRWGQPKLVKPSACKNSNLLGSVKFSWTGGKGPQCKVWLHDDTVYVLHRDWFSSCMPFKDAIKAGIITEKDVRQNKIYNDNFGCVVLRNEAVISFCLPDLSRFILNNRFALVQELAAMLEVNWAGLEGLHRWEDFFMDILKLLMSGEEYNRCNYQ